MSSIRDIYLVARFEVLRAIRTWRALALLLLYGIGYGGASYIFVAILHGLENQVARQLGVATTDKPGALLNKLVESDMFHELILGMTGNENLVAELTRIPPLAIFAMWFGLLLIPFFAASASAECVSIDMGSRALRYEALRTGRLELVLGRFGGQLLLTVAASVVAAGVTWCVGMFSMVGNDPVLLALGVAGMTARAWFFSVPFAGIGVAASTLTTSPAWARVMAISATGGSWVLYGVASWFDDSDWAILSDIAYQLLPQGWMHILWEPWLGWMPAALVLVSMGFAAVGVGYARFSGRDL